MIKTRTKIEAILAASLLIMITIGSVFAVRTITNTGDSFDTFIRNSNGNYWTATGTNLQLAIDDLGTIGGDVDIGSDITLTTAITLKNHTSLNFNNHVVTLSGATTGFINMTGGNIYNVIRDAIVYVPVGSTASIIRLFLPPAASNGWTVRIYCNLFENINIQSVSPTSHNYTGIHFDINSPVLGDGAAMLYNTFNHIMIYYCKYGIYLSSTATNSWMNGNNFNDILIYCCVRGIYFDINSASTGGAGSNLFNFVKMQATTYTTYGIYIDYCDSNSFTNFLIWDWSASLVPIQQFYIGATAFRTYIQTDYLDSTTTNIYDLGNSTTVVSNNYGHFYDKAPYRYIIYRNGTKTFLQDGNTGMVITKSASATTIFQLIASYTTNAVIFIREGTYNISAYFNPGTAITWLGADNHKTFVKATATLASGIVNCNGYHNATFRNICFDGSGLAEKGIYIAFDTSTNGTTIDDCIFKNFTSETGASIYSAAKSSDIVGNTHITNCEFNFCRYAINMMGDADPSVVSGVDVSHNYFKGCMKNIYLEHARNSTINNNIIQNGTTGVYLPDTHNCTITGNVITATNGIAEGDAANDNIIMGNNLRMCTTPTIRIGLTTIITNNIPIGTTGFQLPTSAPTTAVAGSMYVNATTGDIAVYSGAVWIWTHG